MWRSLLVEQLGRCPTPTTRQASGGDRHLKFYEVRDNLTAPAHGVIGRMRMDPTIKAYVTRRTADGLSKPEIIHCSKRYLARDIHELLRPITPAKKHHRTG
jgi:hypothetical protein